MQHAIFSPQDWVPFGGSREAEGHRTLSQTRQATAARRHQLCETEVVVNCLFSEISGLTRREKVKLTSGAVKSIMSRSVMQRSCRPIRKVGDLYG